VPRSASQRHPKKHLYHVQLSAQDPHQGFTYMPVYLVQARDAGVAGERARKEYARTHPKHYTRVHKAFQAPVIDEGDS
jgi:hypothetical protein